MTFEPYQTGTQFVLTKFKLQLQTQFSQRVFNFLQKNLINSSRNACRCYHTQLKKNDYNLFIMSYNLF